MQHHASVKWTIGLALLTGLAGLLLVAPSAAAQGYGRYGAPLPYATGPNEEVTVTAPPFRAEGGSLDIPGKVSLSVPVRYDDLDLRTYHGARLLRVRVREAARDVCAQLADAYPVYELNGTSCYRTAVQNGLMRANAAIGDARLSYYYGYED